MRRHLPGLAPRLAAAITFLAASDAAGETIVGSCRFDVERLAFAGDPARQAACLLRTPGPGGALGATPARLPSALRRRLGHRPAFTIDVLARYMVSYGAPPGLIDRLGDRVSRAMDDAYGAPVARYFVIHDTSQPYLGAAPAFPSDIDTGAAVNDLKGYGGPDAVAHMFINRRGEVLVGHDLSIPWRATKLETRIIGPPAKGLFIHVENQQPRRADPAGPPGNDRIAPTPGFTTSQYRSLALAYIVASFRAGQWLIPAFHADIDEGLPDAHDDPQDFVLETFDEAISRHLRAIASLSAAPPHATQ